MHALLARVIERDLWTPRLAALGIVWALLMGLVGGLMPAWRAASVPVTDVLRTS